MKKLTEYKELDAATFDNSRLPLECKFSNKKEEVRGMLFGIHFSVNALKFEDDAGGWWDNAYEVSKRYPRDVPEGVPPLPKDKPFLASIRQYDPKSIANAPSGCLYLLRENRWTKDAGYFNENLGDEAGVYLCQPTAIDVSTDWARENFPEIVEAMEYEAIRKEHPHIYYDGKKIQELVGHKLGDKTYDLNWQEIKLEEDVETNEESSEVEPPDCEEYLSNTFLPSTLVFRDKKIFHAGKARGKWESHKRWKKILKKVGLEIK